MKISERAFGGIAPRSDARNLPDGLSQTADNVKLWKGTLKPFGGGGSAIKTGNTNALALYRFGQNDPANSDTQYWWTFSTDTSIARGPIFDDNNETTYFTTDTNSGAPLAYELQVTDTTKAGSGNTPSYWKVAVQTPGAWAVQPAVNGTPDTKVDKEFRVYTYTYVNAAGFEGKPSAESAVTTVQQDAGNVATHYVTLTLNEPASGQNDRCYETGAEIRVYCGSYGDQNLIGVIGYNGSAWSVTSGFGTSPTLTDLGSTLTITDKLLSSARGDSCTTGDWEPPPSGADGLKCLKALPNGLLVGIHKNNVCFCDPYHPHAWPYTHRHAIDYQPIALGVYGNSVVVGTNGYPYVITGTEPTAMVPQKLERQQSCVSARSMVDLGGGVAYASPDGLVVVDGSGLNLASEKWYSRDEWQALNPSSIHAIAWDGRYVMFCDPTGDGTWDTGIIWDFTVGPTTLSVGDVRALYVDLKADKLYYALSTGAIHRFDYTGSLTFTWKSKKYEHPQPVNYGCAQVHANAYDNGTTQDLTLYVYADGVLKHTQVVTSRNPFRLPSGFKAREWEFAVSGNVEVFGIDIATNMQELMNG